MGDNKYTSPRNHVIKDLNYTSLGLTPSKMKNMAATLNQMSHDYVWDELLAERKTLSAEHLDTLRLVVYLYGKGLYDDCSSNDRVLKIKGLLSNVAGPNSSKSSPRERLRQIAVSNESDREWDESYDFDVYFRMAATAIWIFKSPDAHGGFPVVPYYRIQKSGNCYIVTVAMFLTLVLQKKDDTQTPIDSAFIGRSFVVDTREGMEKRVLQDKGDTSKTLCERILRDENVFETISFADSSKLLSLEFKMKMLRDCVSVKNGDYAIVSFHLPAPFKECANNKSASKKFGYFEFDGNHVDTEGKFVELQLEDEELIKKLKGRLNCRWNAERDAVAERKSKHQSKMKEDIDASPWCQLTVSQSLSGDTEPSLGDTQTEKRVFNDDNEKDHHTHDNDNDGSAQARHAVVLFGSIKTDDGRHLYVLWNWWARMPLVAVSVDYLIACQSKVYVLTDEEKVNADLFNKINRTKALACECAFPDHGENTSDEAF